MGELLCGYGNEVRELASHFRGELRRNEHAGKETILPLKQWMRKKLEKVVILEMKYVCVCVCVCGRVLQNAMTLKFLFSTILTLLGELDRKWSADLAGLGGLRRDRTSAD